MVRLGRPVFQQLITDAAEACKNTDLIVYTIFGSVAYHIAEKQGIPAIMASLQPLLNPREAFPVPGSPKLFTRTPWLHRLYNRTSYQAAQQIFWQPFRPLVQKWRRKTLSLPRASFFGPYRQLRHNKIPFLEAYSPTVVPPPATWPDWYHTTGYWQLPPSAEWEPPADLQAFLAADSRLPIYFGFGSMADQAPEKLFHIIQTALKQTDQRGIILRGWADITSAQASDNIHFVSSVPHHWLFKRVAAIVHHGGAGTTGSALTAGKPTLVVPYFADQHFWGDRVYTLGAGPKPIPRPALTAENLTAAINEMIHHQHMISAADKIGQALQQENGANYAADILIQSVQTKTLGKTERHKKLT